MSVSAPASTVSSAGRRFGYAVGASVNVVLLYLVNVRPGWQAVPFLTDDTTQVLGWVNASLVAGVAANLLCVAYPAAWLERVGDLVTTAVGLAAVVRMLAVFPFDFGDPASGWEFVARFALIAGIAGSAVAVVVHTVLLLRTAGRAIAGKCGRRSSTNV